MDIAELQSKNVGELHDLATELNLNEYESLRKEALLLRIQNALLERGDTLTTEGVVERVPEGYAFLRSQAWSYVHSPDDVYVSPAQLKEFGLRTGDTIVGEVRPPRGKEKYLALAEVHTINGRRDSNSPRSPATAGSSPLMV